MTELKKRPGHSKILYLLQFQCPSTGLGLCRKLLCVHRQDSQNYVDGYHQGCCPSPKPATFERPRRYPLDNFLSIDINKPEKSHLISSYLELFEHEIDEGAHFRRQVAPA